MLGIEILIILALVSAWKVINPDINYLEQIQIERLFLLTGLTSPYLTFIAYDLYLIIFKKRTVFKEFGSAFVYLSLEGRSARMIEAVILTVGGILAILLIVWASFF